MYEFLPYFVHYNMSRMTPCGSTLHTRPRLNITSRIICVVCTTFGPLRVSLSVLPVNTSLTSVFIAGCCRHCNWTWRRHVLRTIKALIKCPGVALTVEFQGKQAASAGGTAVHYLCESTRGSDHDNLSGVHDDQLRLSAMKAVHWNQASVLAIEEVSKPHRRPLQGRLLYVPLAQGDAFRQQDSSYLR